MKRFRPVAEIIKTAFKASRWRAYASMALFLFNGLSGPLLAALLGMAITRVANGESGGGLALIAVLAALAAAGSAIIGELAWRFSQRVQEETEHALERRTLDLMMRMPSVDHYERPEYLDKVEQLRSENFVLSRSITMVFTVSALSVQIIATFIVLATTDVRLFLLILFAIPQVVAGVKAEKRRIASSVKLREQWRQSDNVVQLVTDPGPAKEIRVFGLGPELLRRHAGSSRISYEREFGDRLWGAWWIAAGSLIFSVAFIGAIAMVAERVISGEAPIGTLVTAVAMCAGLAAQAGAVSAQVTWATWTLTALGRWQWLNDYGNSHSDTAAGESPKVVEREIAFEHVSFSYPGNLEREVLHDVSFTMPAGSTVAIIGDNGAGKTTIVKLLSGMYQPTSGHITVDGKSLTDIDVNGWRDNLSAAFQDHVRFETIAETTIGLGDQARLNDRGRIEESVLRGGATDVVERLPDGLDTQLGAAWENGADLSGGQWQKLALARSMMREPVALILDEPTSALDSETEHALFERFADAASEQRRRGMVTVVISHRFSTVRMADLIVVVSDGRVIEQGTHSQLMAKAGTYAELYELQARAYR